MPSNDGEPAESENYQSHPKVILAMLNESLPSPRMNCCKLKYAYIASLFLCGVFTFTSNAASVLTYDGTSFSASSSATGLTAGVLSAGTDLTGFTFGGGEYAAANWTMSTISSVDSALIFTVTPQVGYSINLTSVSYIYTPQGSGPEKVGFQYSLSDPSARVYVPGGAERLTDAGTGSEPRKTPDVYSATGNLTIDYGQTATFYVLGWDAKNTGKHLYLDDITLNGTVTAIPEPSTCALLCTALVGIFAKRRRRPFNPRQG